MSIIVTAPRASAGSTVTVNSGPACDLPATLYVQRAGKVITALTATAWAGQTITVSGAAAGHADAALRCGDLLLMGCAIDSTGHAALPLGSVGDLLTPLQRPPVVITDTATLAACGTLYIVDSAGDMTATLLAPGGQSGFVAVHATADGTGTVTVAAHSGQNIDGSSSFTLAHGETRLLWTLGTNWFTFAGWKPPA